MIATDNLRRLLDERGVPWRCYGYENHTWWGEWHAENRPSINGLFMKVEGVVTPEQAVEATLGRGTCHDIGTFKSWGLFTCSNCSIVIPLDAAKDAPEAGKSVPLKFCPNCGRKVMY